MQAQDLIRGGLFTQKPRSGLAQSLSSDTGDERGFRVSAPENPCCVTALSWITREDPPPPPIRNGPMRRQAAALNFSRCSLLKPVDDVTAKDGL